MDLVNLSHERLMACQEQLDYLAGRGLPRAAVEKYRLGWVPKVEFKTRKAWDLEDKWNEKEQRAITALAIQQGILIPWIIDGHIHRLRLRKTTVKDSNDPRYLWIDGSGNDIICLNHTAKAHCVIESDLDGLLVDWTAGDLVGAVPLGSCSTKPKATALALLQNSLRILVSLDFDGEIRNDKVHAPGAKASHWWFETFPLTARRWPVPAGKDPGEAHAAGVDLRAWVIAGLPPAMQLAANQPVKPDTAPVINEVTGREINTAAIRGVSPLAAAYELVNELPKLEIRQTKSGRHIAVCYADTVPPSILAEATALGLAMYTTKEIAIMRELELLPEQADVFTDVKELWPGATITEGGVV
jgi:hypothetical protein